MLGKSSPISQALGQLGGNFIADTAEHTGDWGSIYCLSACTFTALDSGVAHDGTTKLITNDAGTGDLSAISLAAGQQIFGRFSKITLASGSVMAYKI